MVVFVSVACQEHSLLNAADGCRYVQGKDWSRIKVRDADRKCKINTYSQVHS